MIIRQYRIHRKDLQANPEVLYVFGDNTARAGYGGQAAACRGESNAVGVRTKHHPSSADSSFFTDDDYEANIKMIAVDWQYCANHLAAGGIVVIPVDGLGTGLSDMANRCPRTFEYLCGLGLGPAS